MTFVTREDWGSAHKLIDIMAEADQEIPDWLIEMSERYKAYRERMRERDGFSRGGKFEYLKGRFIKQFMYLLD